MQAESSTTSGVGVSVGAGVSVGGGSVGASVGVGGSVGASVGAGGSVGTDVGAGASVGAVVGSTATVVGSAAPHAPKRMRVAKSNRATIALVCHFARDVFVMLIRSSPGEVSGVRTAIQSATLMLRDAAADALPSKECGWANVPARCPSALTNVSKDYAALRRRR